MNSTVSPWVSICHNEDPTSLGQCVDYFQSKNLAFQWYAIHSVALAVIIPAVLGSLSIIITSLKEARNGSLTTFQRFPLWISICDCSFGVFHGIDHVHSLIRGRIMDGGGCLFLGWSTMFSINTLAFWISAVSLCIHTVVVRKKKLMVGTRDWVLHTICWGIPLFYGLFGFMNQDYGQEPLWCGMPKNRLYFNGIFILISMVLNSVVYGHISYHLYSYLSQRRAAKNEIGWVSLHPFNKAKETTSGTNKTLQDDTSSPTFASTKREALSTDDRLMRMAKQMPIFVFIYIMVWLLVFISIIWGLVGDGSKIPFEYNLLVVVFANSGGIFNAIAYRKYLIKSRSSESNESTGISQEK